MKYDTTLRENGLPFLIPVSRWSRGVIWRATPLILFNALSVLGLFLYVALVPMLMHTDTTLSFSESVLFLLFTVGAPLSISAIAWRYGDTNSHQRTVIASGALLIWITSIAISWKLDSASSALGVLSTGLAVLLLAWLGITSLMRWGLATAIKQIAPLLVASGKVLPISITIVIFGYFSAEFWQIADRLSPMSVFGFLLFLSLIALVTSISVARSELKDHEVSLATSSSRRGLHRARIFNIYFVIASAQIIQSILFFVGFSIVLVIISKIVLSDELLSKWIEHPIQYIKIGSQLLPISKNHLYTAGFAAAITSFNLLVVSSTDAQLREKLFDPIIQNIKRILAR